MESVATSSRSHLLAHSQYSNHAKKKEIKKGLWRRKNNTLLLPVTPKARKFTKSEG